VPTIEERVRNALAGCAHLGELARLRTLHLGPQNILVAVCWRFRGEPVYATARTAFAEIEADIRAADPRVSDVLFEFVDQPPPPEVASSAPRSSSADDTARPDPHARLREPRA
jgi:hypothetical protein